MTLLTWLRPQLLAHTPRLFARLFTPDPRELGLLGEELVARALRRQGAAILARRLRTRAGELDLLARDSRGLVCIEVKSARAAPIPRPRGAVHIPAPPGPGARVGPHGAWRLARIASQLARGLGEPARCEVWACTLDDCGRARVGRRPGSDFLASARG